MWCENHLSLCGFLSFLCIFIIGWTIQVIYSEQALVWRSLHSQPSVLCNALLKMIQQVLWKEELHSLWASGSLSQEAGRSSRSMCEMWITFICRTARSERVWLCRRCSRSRHHSPCRLSPQATPDVDEEGFSLRPGDEGDDILPAKQQDTFFCNFSRFGRLSGSVLLIKN